MRHLSTINRLGSKLFALVAIMLSLQVYSSESVNVSNYDMKNTANPLTNLLTGGQPSINDLKKMAQNGIKVVVNLRATDEFSVFDERSLVESLGMKYVAIPISGAKDFNLQNVKILDNALNSFNESTLVHCASSNRVGGLLALRENMVKKSSAQESINFGRKAGMKSTEKIVKKMIK